MNMICGMDVAIAAMMSDALAQCMNDPLKLNLLAATWAEAIAKGKNRGEIEAACKFLQLLQSALRAYM